MQRAKEKELMIYMGSDAHYYLEIGKFDRSIALLNEIDYPKELILNCRADKLSEMFD